MEDSPDIPQPAEPKNASVREGSKKEFDKKQLTNKLNYINFLDGHILFNFRHARFNSAITLQAKPQPSLGEWVECLWVNPTEAAKVLPSYNFDNILLPDGQKILLLKPEQLSLSNQKASFRLPETARLACLRKQTRFPCEGIRVQLLQNGASFSGELRDFSAVAFRVELNIIPPQTFDWINPQEEVNVSLAASQDLLYSGSCRIIRHDDRNQRPTLVLAPQNQQSRRFQGRKFRSLRMKLVPPPNLTFRHPLTRRNVDLKVIDLSGSGFAVEEEAKHSVLLPGLVIPAAELAFASSLRIRCRAQVIYRSSEAASAPERCRCGLAILDMAMEDQVRLMAMLQQARDRHSYVCNAVDQDALWRFFFETGFIYPEKYLHIKNNSDHFRSIYDQLYLQSPKIARHFLHQENGEIHGHIAMLRFYNNAWMIHHHAANKLESKRAGLIVLSQISQYVNELHRLASAHLQYVFCYFRPENKFPAKVFGGAAAHIDDPQGCWTRPFSYFHFDRSQAISLDMSAPWNLTETDADDLRLLRDFFSYESSPLLLKAFDLLPDTYQNDLVAPEYRAAGFQKERLLFSLKKDNELQAIFLLNISEPCLNLSELANCIHIFSLDQENLIKREIIQRALSILSIKFEQETIPVLSYPSSLAEKVSFPNEKLYNLWVLDLKFLDKYFEFCNNLYPDFIKSTS